MNSETLSPLTTINYKPIVAEHLPQGCEFFLTHDFDNNFSLLPEELALTHKMVPKRLREFSAGRHCARQVLSRYGINEYALLAGTQREPRWPDGIVGSLSHCANFCLAVVTLESRYASIGVDVEEASPLDENLLSMICNESETSQLTLFPQPLVAAKIIFSIKESIYKSLYRLHQRWIDFLEVEIGLSPKSNEYSISLNNSLQSSLQKRQILGKWYCDDNFIVSSNWCCG